MTVPVPNNPQTIRDYRSRWCVIGAGPCGLTAAKNLHHAGLEVDVIEREDDVGGNWYYGKPSSSVFASTHLISSKRMTEYTDYPMPKSFPPFPSHQQAWAYLRDYAWHFGLYPLIAFGTSVEAAEPAADGGWHVRLSTGETRHYRGLIVANGHHWDPCYAELPGIFTGEQLHAHNYKTPDVLKGKRVLVIGAGNSGCDLAVEAAQHADAATISLRRGYHFLPKFLLGRPIDSCGNWLQSWHVPLWLRRKITAGLIRIAVGPLDNYGLPQPDHRLFETHPIINSQLLYFVGHGRIAVRPAIKNIQGDEVEFADGRRETFDLLVHATGYHVRFPFLDSRLLLEENGLPRLFLNVFPPARDDLFVIGLIQPNSGIWGLADLQSQLLARYLKAREQGTSVTWFEKLKARGPADLSGGIHYLKSPRHAIEVEYFSYRRRLRKLIGQLPPA